MKNTILSLILAVFLVMGAAYAAGEVTVNQSSVYFSGNNKDIYTSKDEKVNAQGFITLTNHLDSAVTVKFANTELTHSSNSDKINITNQIIPLAWNQTLTKEIRVESTKDIEAGEYNGVLQIVNNSNPTQVFDEIAVKVLVPSLEVTEITVKDKESGNSDTKLEKGQTFTVTVEYKNIADQTDLENLNVKVGVYDGDDTKLSELIQDIDEDDLESDDDGSDLSNGKSNTMTFDFEMPYDIGDKDTMTVFAEVTADSQDTSASFYAKDTKEISTSVPDDKLEITKLTATPSSLTCGATPRAKISLELKNIGSNAQDVELFLRNSATSFEKQLNNGDELEVDNDFSDEDSFTATLDEYVTLTDLKTGDNTYTLYAYYNDGDSSVTKDVVIASQSCTATTPAVKNTTQPIVNINPSTPITNPTVPNIPVTTTPYVSLKDVSGSGFSLDNDWVIPAVIGVGGLIIGLVVALLVMPRP